MALDVVTKDCTQLSDAELAEMADLCAEGPERATRSGPSTSRPRRGCCARWSARATPCVASRSPRSSASAARRRCSSAWPCVKRHSKRDPVLKAAHGRQLPPGADGLPRRGRPRRHPSSTGADEFEAFKVLIDINPPARPQGVGRGAGLGPAPGQAVRRRRRLRRPVVRRQAATARTRWCSTTSRSSPRRIDPEVAKFFKPLKPKQGDCLDHLRLDHGRRAAQVLRLTRRGGRSRDGARRSRRSCRTT